MITMISFGGIFSLSPCIIINRMMIIKEERYENI